MSIINPNSNPTVSTTTANTPTTDKATTQSSTQSKPTHPSMRVASGAQVLGKIGVLPDGAMDPTPPKSVTGYDLSSTGKEVVQNLETEITCRSEKGIRGSSEQALLLQSKGREVSVTFALNDEPYSVLTEHVLKMSKAKIPVRLVAGDRATRGPDRENGTMIMQKVLENIQHKIMTGTVENSEMKKLKMKVCYHDGSELQFVADKIRLTEEYQCMLDEVSIQIQPIDTLEDSFDTLANYLNSVNKAGTPVVSYAIVFANQDTYERSSQRIKDMAGHAYNDQFEYLSTMKSIVDRFEDASIRLSFFGFSKLDWRTRTAAINRCYAALQ